MRLIDAMATLGRRDVYCLLPGAEATPTALEQALKRRIEARGLGGIVRVAPFCEDMPAAYMLSDAVVAGGEGQGLHRLVRESCDQVAAIPLYGPVDSLNVSVAAGVVLYEAARQRRSGAAR